MNRAALSRFLFELQSRCDLLRKTADELATGKIHPNHAANRIRRIAGEIAKPTVSADGCGVRKQVTEFRGDQRRRA